MGIIIQLIPVQGGNNIFLTGVDLDKEYITYRRGLTPGLEITEEFIVKQDDKQPLVVTKAIFFYLGYLQKFIAENEIVQQ